MKRNLLFVSYSTFRKTALVGFLFLGLNQLPVWATPSGANYRTKGNGNWTSPSTWEKYDSNTSTWKSITDLLDIPDETAGEITILQNNTVTVIGNLSADQITVELGANLILSGSLTIPSGAQPGLMVNGTIMVDNGGTLAPNNHAVTGGGEFMLESGGTLEIGSAEGIWSSHLSPAGNVGSIQVLGQRAFSANATFIYDGTTPQITGNALANSISKLVIKNPQGVSLSQPLEIATELTLVEGKLRPLTHGITVASTASITPPAANKVSFVEGPLAVKASAPKVIQFPIGRGNNYRLLTLNIGTTNGENTYTAEQFDQPFAIPAGTTIPEQVDKISGIRYFNITKTGSYNVSANLTVSYASDDNVTNATKLALVKYDAGTGWEYLGGSGATNGSGSITSGNFTTFSSFMLANQNGGTNPLPVELTNFAAKSRQSEVQLNWATASESNSDRYEIERSLNGKNFEKVGVMKASGNSTVEKRYAFTDKNPGSNLVYYRLKQVDFDGTSSYSQVVTVRLVTTLESVIAYPNPVASELTVKSISGNISKVTIRNILGQEVYQQNVTNLNQTSLNLSFLPVGTYQLVVQNNNHQVTLKIIKAN